MRNYKLRVLMVFFLCISLLSAVLHPVASLPGIARGDHFAAANIQPLDVALTTASGAVAEAAAIEAPDRDAATLARALTKNGARNQQRQLRSVHAETEPGGTQPAVYIVQLVDAPLATYRGDLANLSATSPKATGERKLDIANPASTNYRAYLAQRRTDFQRAAENQLGHALDVLYAYEVAFHGVALQLTPQEAAKLVNLAGVATIQRSQWRQAMTDTSPAFLNVLSIWNGSNTGGLPGTKGEGIIVGIIDSGIWPEHPSFADDGSYPAPPASWKGSCQQPQDDSLPYTCNNKLIGAQYFLAGYSTVAGYDGLFYSARDDDGHGTHTASTAAGNEQVPATIYGINRGFVSGMAPRAYVAAYKGLGPSGGTTADLVAAIDKAVADGVDVINYSVGSDFAADPWVDADAQAYLAALEAGVFVATSAGNAGPGVSTIGSPANAPWITTVGASYFNRLYLSDITVQASGGATLALYGATSTAGVTNFRLVNAEGIEDSAGDTEGNCAAPFRPGTFQATDVVICRSGAVATWVIGNFVQAGGASAVIIYNNEGSYDLNSYLYSLPAVRILTEAGEQLSQFMADHAGEQFSASFTQGTAIFTPDPRIPVDTVVGFSSRGPALNQTQAQLLDVIKPDVTAPGIHVLAGASPEHVSDANGELDLYGAQGQLFQVIQGTSMSSPHVAGVGALLQALHPTWTPGQIRSALMTTALYTGQKARDPDGDHAADPFDLGAGRIDMGRAPLAGFTLDETAASFKAADPTLGGDPSRLNLASVTDANCVAACTWVRTIKSTLDTSVDWSVSASLPPTLTVLVTPNNFSLAAGASQVVTITADVSNAGYDKWVYGTILFTSNSTRTVDAHFPLAVRAKSGNLPASVTIETRRNAGAYTVAGLQTVTVANLGLALTTGEPQSQAITLASDPTNLNPYDLAAGGVYTSLVTVSATTKRFVVEILSSTAPDLDLFVGRDTNGNGQPDAGEELCSSVSETWTEICDFPQLEEALESGVYWLLIQNWSGSDLAKDEVTYAVTLIDAASTGAMTATGPASTVVGSPFAVQIAWDVPTFKAGQARYGYLELTDINANVQLGSIPVTLNRIEDDVVKSADFAGQAVQPGSIVTYTVDIRPEITGNTTTLQYRLTDTLPVGVTYIPGSATPAPTIVGNQLIWTVDLTSQPAYVMTTSANDPLCDTGSNGYVNLAAFGIEPDAQISGNQVSFRFDSFYGGDDPVNFFGVNYANGLYFTDDGFATLSPNVGANPATNLALPNPALPNNLLAPFWRDLAIVYDANAGRGVSVAGTASGMMVVEYDDVEPAPVGSTNSRYDFEIVMQRQPDNRPGVYEIVFAYANLNGDLTPATIGIENADGTLGLQYAHNNAQLGNNFMVCYDWAMPEATISYAVKVDDTLSVPATLVNRVDHSVNLPDTKVETTRLTLEVPDVLLAAALTAPQVVAPSSNITFTLTVTNTGIGTANQITAQTTVPPGTTYVSGGTLITETIRFTLGDIPGKSSKQAQLVVKPQAGVENVTAATVQSVAAPQIVGGTEAAPGAWPWQVALVARTQPNAFLGQFCGASLLTPNWVLTAAHCVTHGTESVPAAALDIVIGRHALTETVGQRLPISQIVVHPAWDPTTNDFDIALLRLGQPALLSGAIGIPGAIQPVTLAMPSESALITPARLATVTGWGTRTAGVADYPHTLYQVTVPLVAQATCAANYAAIDSSIELTDRMLCAGFAEGGKDACQGDSGGPLVVNDNGIWKQVGIVSWGAGCADPGVPGVYTRLPIFYDWIKGDGTHTYANLAFTVQDANGRTLFVAASTAATIVADRTTRTYMPIIRR